MLRAALLALLVLCTAPLASACSLVPPSDHERVLWTDGERVLVNRGLEYGFLSLRTGDYEGIVTPFALSPPTLDPAGAWMAWQVADGLGGDCSPVGGEMRARGPSGGTETVRAAPAWTYAATTTHLVVAYRDSANLTLHPWGAWEDAREVPLGDARAGQVVPSPDGRWIAAYDGSARRVLLVDATQARLARTLDVEEDAWGLAFSPAGDRLAVLTLRSSEHARLRVFSVPTGEVLAERRDEDAVAGDLAWGAPGIAYATHRREPGAGSALTEVTLRLLAPADLIETATTRLDAASTGRGIVFAPDGRVLLGLDGRLRAFDAELRELPLPGGSPVPWGGAAAAGALLLAALAGRRLARSGGGRGA